MIISKSSGLHGKIKVPGDKSISHRSVMLGALSEGTSHITGFLNGADCISTINCFRSMGVDIEYSGGSELTVHGTGLYGLKEPSDILYCGNSGTTTRILSGILAGQSFSSTLTGDNSIQKRPMKRIIDPLRMMGSDIISIKDNGCAPLRISPSKLHGIDYTMPVASAQVKSCLLMAALYADGDTVIREPALSRDHTEIMLEAMGAAISRSDSGVVLHPGNKLSSRDISVPGDISSAAYFLGAALLIPDSDILIENVGINPTRDGIIHVLKKMGGNISLMDQRSSAGEPVADIHVKSSELSGTEISGDIIPALIDELPLIAVAAAMAHGTTVIKDAGELRVKESDRIALVTGNLKAMGADIEATDDGFIINGKDGDPRPLKGTRIDDANDHRIAMSFTVAGMAASGETTISHPECAAVSYPGFFEDISSLTDR